MLKQEVYQTASDIFGVSVGVANFITYKNVKDESEDEASTPEEFKMVTDELEINDIICRAIEIGMYKDLQINIYNRNKKRHGRTKEVTIYKNAWKDLTHGNR